MQVPVDGNPAVCGPINSNLNDKNDIKSIIRPRSKHLICSFNARSLTSHWRQNELVSYCFEKQIGILAIQQHRIHFPTNPGDDPVVYKCLGKGWWFIYTSATVKGHGGIGFIVSPKFYRNICGIYI